MVRAAQPRNNGSKPTVAEPTAKAKWRKGRAPLSIDVYVGNRIRVRRTLAGMSQTGLGDAVGLTFQQIQKYENGKNRVAAGQLYEIAQALGCNPGDFYEGFEGEAGAPSEDLPQALFATDTLKLFKAFEALDENARKAVLAFARSLSNAD